MRLIHLSDLHIGKRVNEFSMLEDQRYILEQVTAIAVEQDVDGVIIAGDVYDKAVPPESAVRLFDDFLTQLTAHHLPVYLISGNHDSADRLSFGGRILQQQQLYFSTVFDGTLRRISLSDGHGPIHLYLMPFLKPAVVRPFFPEDGIETYEDAVRTVLAYSEIDPAARNILVAHQFITNNGQEPERSDSELIAVGGVDQVDVSLFDAFDYVALGHLHGPQKIGRETVRYCGSPLKYSFSECRQRKSVTIVTLEEKGNVAIETVPLQPLRDLREIRGKLEDLIQPIVAASANPDDYLRVILTDETPLYHPMEQLRQVYPNVMRLETQRDGTTETFSVTAASKVEDRSVLELFADFYAMANGTEMTSEEIAVMERLTDEMAGDRQ